MITVEMSDPGATGGWPRGMSGRSSERLDRPSRPQSGSPLSLPCSTSWDDSRGSVSPPAGPTGRRTSGTCWCGRGTCSGTIPPPVLTSRTLLPHPHRRVPGHRSPTGGDRLLPCRRAGRGGEGQSVAHASAHSREAVRRWGRQAGDLPLPRRRHGCYPDGEGRRTTRAPVARREPSLPGADPKLGERSLRQMRAHGI